MSMARGSQKTDKVKKQNIDLWPLTRFLVGTTSLIIGVVFIFTTARTIVGREITLIEITQVPASFIRGMFSSWPRFVVGFWLLLTFGSKLAMLFNSRQPVSLVSAFWFIWFSVIGRVTSSKSTVSGLVIEEKVIDEVVRYFGIALYTLLLTDILDAFYWIFGKIEDWADKENRE